FPVLESPDAIDLLDGKTFVEACNSFVFDDPQLLARRKRAEAVGGKPARFGFFRPPFRSIWPVTYGRDRTWDNPIGLLSRHDKPFRPMRLADLPLERRFSHLIEYLADGAIVAVGLSQCGSPMEVPRSIWCRGPTFIDLENGDLYEMSTL